MRHTTRVVSMLSTFPPTFDKPNVLIKCLVYYSTPHAANSHFSLRFKTLNLSTNQDLSPVCVGLHKLKLHLLQMEGKSTEVADI